MKTFDSYKICIPYTRVSQSYWWEVRIGFNNDNLQFKKTLIIQSSKWDQIKHSSEKQSVFLIVN